MQKSHCANVFCLIKQRWEWFRLAEDWLSMMCKSLSLIYLEPQWPLFLKVNTPKQGLFQQKQWSFRFQVQISTLGISSVNATNNKRNHSPHESFWLMHFLGVAQSEPMKRRQHHYQLLLSWLLEDFWGHQPEKNSEIARSNLWCDAQPLARMHYLEGKVKT